MSYVVWCTGAGKGIGRAVCLRLARDGATVAASARTESDLRQLVSDASGLSGRIVPFAVDVTDEAAMAESVRSIESELGAIDVALLNAGTHIPVSADNFRTEPFRRLFEVNVMGVVHGIAALLPSLTARRSGHIAVVSSVAGYRGLPTAAAYGASKAAVINMCESLKPELDALGIRMTLINPGFVKTPLTDKNDFEMPFLMDVDAAADRIVEGLGRSGFEISFPRRFTWLLKITRCLPYGAYFFLARYLLKGS